MSTTQHAERRLARPKSLSGLDATFLYLETPETPMHVGGWHLVELPSGFKGSFHSQLREHMVRRIHLAALFTHKLAFMPFDLGHPVWVEDEDFDLDQHIHKMPAKNGSKLWTEASAQTQVAALHSQLIDRSRPLWQFYVFDSITSSSGARKAGFFAKIHHAALDGQGGTVLANAILDLGPVPREVPPPDLSRRRAPRASELKIGQMIGAAFSNSLAQVAKIAQSLPTVASSARELGGEFVGKAARSGQSHALSSPITLAPRTPFNVPVGTDRVFVTTSLPFAECRAMSKAIGASFNDIVLWIISTALREYLAQHGGVPKKPLIAAMPVSLREESNQELGNHASMSLVDLATHIAHPMKRMQAIMVSTAKVKEALGKLKSVLPTDYPGLLAPWLVGGAARLAMKGLSQNALMQRLPMLANVIISNVPGPQVPLFLAGGQIASFHPLSIVLHGIGLNFTLQTYAGRVDFGIVAGQQALPHAQDLVDAIESAFAQAQALYKQSLAAQNPGPAGQAPAKAAAPAANAAAAAPVATAPVKTTRARVPGATTAKKTRSKTPAPAENTARTVKKSSDTARQAKRGR
jgi:diacylglycerol O-acyltransferase / wax synthase